MHQVLYVLSPSPSPSLASRPSYLETSPPFYIRMCICHQNKSTSLSAVSTTGCCPGLPQHRIRSAQYRQELLALYPSTGCVSLSLHICTVLYISILLCCLHSHYPSSAGLVLGLGPGLFLLSPSLLRVSDIRYLSRLRALSYSSSTASAPGLSLPLFLPLLILPFSCSYCCCCSHFTPKPPMSR